MNHLESNIGLYLLGALLIAITAFVYSYILIQPGEFFGKIYGWLDMFFKTDERVNAGKAKHPIFKMIMACEKCVAGQISFWIFLILNLKNYSVFIGIAHVLLIGLTIFLTLIVKKIYITYIE